MKLDIGILFLYWWQMKRKDRRENYGDLLSKFLAEKISGKSVYTVKHPSERLFKHVFKHYLSIGSIITSANKNSVVWGSGIIKANENVRKATFLAVRGPKTRERLLHLGYNVPEVYGDPAILLPKFLMLKVDKKHDLGIIPHYVDYPLVKEAFKNNPNVKVIDFLTHSIEKTTEEILECRQIISSSLHGLIVSQSYGIPALWVKFSAKLSGDNIKFYDYFESVGVNCQEEYALNAEALSEEKLVSLLKSTPNNLLPQSQMLALRQEQLLKSCPFKP